MQRFTFFSIVFSFLTAICLGQTHIWKYQTVIDEFDGKIKTCYVIGVGSEFPYESPKFVINKRIVIRDTAKKTNYQKYKERNIKPAEDTINIYISDVPYSGCEVNNAKIKFDTSETVFFPKISMNPDRKEWFMEILNEDEFHEFFRLLKTGRQMTIRLYSNCISEYTARFSLNGSGAAIDYVLK